MKKIVSFLVMLTILVSFASCGSNQKQEELKVEKPDAVNTDANIQEKPNKEYTTDCAKLFKSTINFEMEPIIKDEIPNKPQKLYFNQLGCEWVKDIQDVFSIEGQYAWLFDNDPWGKLRSLSCIDLRDDKTVWIFEPSYERNFLCDGKSFQLYPPHSPLDFRIEYDNGYFIGALSYYGDGGEMTFFGPIDKYSGKLLWVKYDHQRIEDFQIMKDSNKFVYRKMNGTEVFVTLDLITGKELFSSKLETKIFTIDYSQELNYSSNLQIWYFSANNHLILFTSTREKIDTPEGKGYDCTIYHIPTEKGQIYWKVTYVEKADIYNMCLPRLLKSFIVVPSYSDTKSYFLNYEDGSFLHKNDLKQSIDIYNSISIFEFKESQIIDNGINICKYNNNDFTKPVWKYDKNDLKIIIFDFIFNGNILLMRYNIDKTITFICLESKTGSMIWESKIDDRSYNKLLNRCIYSDFIGFGMNYDVNLWFIDSFLVFDGNVFDLVDGSKYIVSSDFCTKSYNRKLFGNVLLYCRSNYLIKYELPTENKVLMYPSVVQLFTDSRYNNHDDEKIIIFNTTDKAIQFTLEFTDYDHSRDSNKLFDKYFSISTKKLIINPFSKSFFTINRIKSKNPNVESFFLKWLKIKFNSEERKILIKVNEPECGDV